MPVGAAIAGAAVVGGGATLAASSKAAGAAKEATAENNALLRELYGENSANIQPYIQAGNAGTNALLQHLGLGSSDGTTGSGNVWDSYLTANPDVADYYNQNAYQLQQMGYATPEDYAQFHYDRYGKSEMDAGTRPAWDPNAGAGATTAGAGSYTGEPDYGTRPTFTRPAAAPLDISLAAYQQSPDFQFQMDRGIDALKSDRTLNGLLKSGDAVKSALGFAENLALGDYGQWRNYVTGNYYNDLSRQDQNYESDRNFGTGTWEADRGFAANRYDTRTNDLLNLSNSGLSGASALAGVSTNYGAQATQNNANQAGITANAALSGAGQVNSLLGDLAYAYGRRGSSYGGSGSGANTGSAYTYSGNSYGPSRT